MNNDRFYQENVENLGDSDVCENMLIDEYWNNKKI